MQRFQVHAEWKEREPGKLVWSHREMTVEIEARDFSAVTLKAKQRFPIAKVSYKQITKAKV